MSNERSEETVITYDFDISFLEITENFQWAQRVGSTRSKKIVITYEFH